MFANLLEILRSYFQQINLSLVKILTLSNQNWHYNMSKYFGGGIMEMFRPWHFQMPITQKLFWQSFLNFAKLFLTNQSFFGEENFNPFWLKLTLQYPFTPPLPPSFLPFLYCRILLILHLQKARWNSNWFYLIRKL